MPRRHREFGRTLLFRVLPLPMSPQGAGRARCSPRCLSSSKRKVVELAVIDAVIWLRGFLELLRRHRANGPELDLVPGAGSRLRDLSHELPADHALQRDTSLLVEVPAQTRFKDAPCFGALLYLPCILVAVGIVSKGV